MHIAEGSRHKSREMALQLLFQSEFLPQNSKADTQDIVNRFAESFQIAADTADYGRSLYFGIIGARDRIDSAIRTASPNWKLDRMAAVDRAIIRIGVYEMLIMKPALPLHIAIDEAVEIAKKYGGTETPSFVNGVLDQIARDQGLKS